MNAARKIALFASTFVPVLNGRTQTYYAPIAYRREVIAASQSQLLLR